MKIYNTLAKISIQSDSEYSNTVIRWCVKYVPNSSMEVRDKSIKNSKYINFLIDTQYKMQL